MEEMLGKLIDEGKREHDEMKTFIREFRTTNELLLKEQNNLLSELRIEVHGLSRVMNDVLILKNEVKGVTTTGGKMTTRIAYNDEINNINKEPSELPRDKPEEPRDMPKYAKFLKSLLTNKSRLEEACTITMYERCSAVLLNKLSSKKKVPGSFTIPCHIGDLQINNALADLEASISLMPYTMYEKLGIGEPKPTRMSLELADRSIQYPRGIVENVLIKVDKFVLSIDFVILDMPEDSRILIILGRPFLATARAMIDVFNKKITLRILIAPEDQEKTTFTCPYGTFVYRRMPFGLCNALATFQRCMTAIFHDMVEDFMEVMAAPTILVAADSSEGNFRDTIDIGVEVIHPVLVASVVFPAATLVMTLAQHEEAIHGINEHLLGVPIQEDLTALRNRVDIRQRMLLCALRLGL
ncbi:reverse transcriptase domain-containing protein [Tanacetum coccineum]